MSECKIAIEGDGVKINRSLTPNQLRRITNVLLNIEEREWYEKETLNADRQESSPQALPKNE